MKASICSQVILLFRQIELNGSGGLQSVHPRLSGSGVIANSTLIANPLPHLYGVSYGAATSFGTRSSSDAMYDVTKFVRLMTVSLTSAVQVSSARHWFS